MRLCEGNPIPPTLKWVAPDVQQRVTSETVVESATVRIRVDVLTDR